MNLNVNLASLSSATAILGTQGNQVGKSASPDAQSAQLPQDHVTVSSVGDLVTAALQQPEVRADKVSALREAVASGTYKVDPQAIASSMLADEL